MISCLEFEGESTMKTQIVYSKRMWTAVLPQSFSAITASGITSGAPSNVNANVCAAQTRTRRRWFNQCAFADPRGDRDALNRNRYASMASSGLPRVSGTDVKTNAAPAKQIAP